MTEPNLAILFYYSRDLPSHFHVNLAREVV